MNTILVTLLLQIALIGGARFALPAGGQESGHSAKVADHFRAGQQALRAGRAADAVQEFKDVLRLEPRLTAAEINLGLAYHLLGRYRFAVAALAAGLRQNPNVLGANVVLGLDELELGAPARAIAPLKQALRLDPVNQKAWSALADAELSLGNYFDASRAYRSSVRHGSDTSASWYRLGHDYLGMSEQLVAKMMRDFKNSAWTERLAGDTLRARGQWAGAARSYQIAISRNPAQPGLHAARGGALLQQGKLAEADREYRSELRLNPSNPQALIGLAELDLVQDRPEDALANAARAAETSPAFVLEKSNADDPPLKLSPAPTADLARRLSSAPSSPAAHFLLALVYRAAGELQLARVQLADLARFSNQDVLARADDAQSCSSGRYEACISRLEKQTRLNKANFLALGRAYFELQQFEKASDAFASAFAEAAQNPAAVYWLASSYEKLAAECFSRVSSHYPDSAEAHELQAETDRARGDDAGAIREYQAAAKLQPQNALLYEAMGELYLEANNVAAADRELRETLKLDPTRAHSLYLMGRVQIGLQQPSAAIGTLKEALRYDPSLLQAHVSLGIAYLHAGKPALAAPQLQQSASLDRYGDLHYMLFQAYRALGKGAEAQHALAVSQALRRKTAAQAQRVVDSAEGK